MCRQRTIPSIRFPGTTTPMFLVTPLPSKYQIRLVPNQYAVVGLLGLYLAAQLLVPLRQHLYPVNVSWTEEGHE